MLAAFFRFGLIALAFIFGVIGLVYLVGTFAQATAIQQTAGAGVATGFFAAAGVLVLVAILSELDDIRERGKDDQ